MNTHDQNPHPRVTMFEHSDARCKRALLKDLKYGYQSDARVMANKRPRMGGYPSHHCCITDGMTGIEIIQERNLKDKISNLFTGDESNNDYRN